MCAGVRIARRGKIMRPKQTFPMRFDMIIEKFLYDMIKTTKCFDRQPVIISGRKELLSSNISCIMLRLKSSLHSIQQRSYLAYSTQANMEYSICSLHTRPDLFNSYAKLLKSTWPHTKTEWLQHLENEKCDGFPCSLVLIEHREQVPDSVIGHIRVVPCPDPPKSIYFEALCIDKSRQSLGLGKKARQFAERYAAETYRVYLDRCRHDDLLWTSFVSGVPKVYNFHGLWEFTWSFQHGLQLEGQHASTWLEVCLRRYHRFWRWFERHDSLYLVKSSAKFDLWLGKINLVLEFENNANKIGMALCINSNIYYWFWTWLKAVL